jgi:hypothetical protein
MHESHPQHELHDISDLDPDGLPSNRSLVKASLIAVAVAAALLVIAILPAEYGIDPTGVGAKLGLAALHAVDAGTAGAASGPLQKSDSPYRTNTLTVSLAPRHGAEIKAVMEQGQSFVFQWKAEGGPVYFDMHGEPPDAKDTFTSFWIGEAQASASGTFQAPFKGVHGWYWENRGDQPVTIHLKTSGFYETLFMP